LHHQIFTEAFGESGVKVAAKKPLGLVLGEVGDRGATAIAAAVGLWE